MKKIILTLLILVSPYYNCDADIYTASGDKGKEIEFHVNRRKNKVVVYTLAYRNGYTTTQEKSYEECLQIAKEGQKRTKKRINQKRLRNIRITLTESKLNASSAWRKAATAVL